MVNIIRLTARETDGKRAAAVDSAVGKAAVAVGIAAVAAIARRRLNGSPTAGR